VEWTVKGIVRDENGTGLPGINVVLKGSTTGTTTDPQGAYTITVPDSNGTPVFSYIGYVTQEVPINNRTTIDLSLVPDYPEIKFILAESYFQTANRTEAYNNYLAGIQASMEKLGVAEAQIAAYLAAPQVAKGAEGAATLRHHAAKVPGPVPANGNLDRHAPLPVRPRACTWACKSRLTFNCPAHPGFSGRTWPTTNRA
jgi:hypothetical protein